MRESPHDACDFGTGDLRMQNSFRTRLASSVLIAPSSIPEQPVMQDHETRLQRSTAGTSTFGRRPDDGIHSFSVLGKRNGNWVCLIFTRRPERVDDERTLQLGHELVHCLLGDYHVFR